MDLAALQKLIGSERDGAMLRLTLARAHLQQQQADAAIEQLQQALAFDPDYTAAWQLLGQVHADQGHTDAALQAWQQGLAASARRGDQQTGKMLQVFIRRLQKP
ncbi:MAG: tetratricopeptide repeat protein [Gammaproteobacteria bacterium]|nr:tetratricopeptide repeat protein [Gammaproteobacteria bacterium]